jgi:hypothetical protein
MGKHQEVVTDDLRRFIESQHVFFVGTAPLAANGRVNVSPKGATPIRVLGPRTVAYLDHVGSGAETIAHLRENGRITLMLCAFDGRPRIVRLYGQGRVIEPQDSEYPVLAQTFDSDLPGRSVIHIEVERVSESCGFGVPLLTFQGSRSHLKDWAERKGSEGVRRYQAENNAVSIDGLPALRWVRPD